MKRLFLLEDDLSLINGLSFAVKKQGYDCPYYTGSGYIVGRWKI